MVEIKPFDLQNVVTHYNWNNDEELNYYDSEYPHIYESFESFLKRVKSVIDDQNAAADLFEIHLSDNNELIGIVDIHSIDTYNRRCFVECTIGDKDFANRGYEGEALRRALDYCFSEMEMHKVCVSSFDFNTNWIEQVLSLGFRKEGEFRDHVLKKGKYRNKLFFGLLAEEYEKAIFEEQEKVSVIN